MFRFTTLPGIYGSDGDSIPSLFISNDGKFMFRSSVNNNFNHGLDIDFELNTMYNVSIGQQIDEDGKYWYEILIDGDSKLKIENKNHRSYTNVKLYASDSFVDPFISNFGSICQVKIQPEPSNNNLPPQCSDYGILNQAWRNTNFTFSKSSDRMCDYYGFPSGWYRMMPPAGVRFPEYAVPQYKCGTRYPGWMDGIHPTILGEQVERKICFLHSNSNTCFWNRNIDVTNCGDYYVYYLIYSPDCDLAYCAEIEGNFFFLCLPQKQRFMHIVICLPFQ